jgi:hypothetical protein
MGIVVHLVDATISSDASGFSERSSRTRDDVVIEVAGMCNGVIQALSDAKKATKKKTVDALVFYGHGAGGLQGVSMGKGAVGVSGSKERAALSSGVLDDPSVLAAFSAFAPNFTDKGVIVLHGCNVAEGTVGQDFLKKLSKATGVPVKGSDWFQIVGRTDLSGNILTATPSGSISEDVKTGMKNLGGLPPGEGLLLLGVEFGDRMLRRFGWK